MTISETDWAGDGAGGDSANGGGLDAAFGAVPTRDFDLSCEELLTQLPDDELRAIAMAKLMGYTNKELATRLECTQRRIERKLQVIRLAWEKDSKPS